MPVQLLETGEEDSLLAVAQHIADLLNEGQAKTALAETPGSRFYDDCANLVQEERFADYAARISGQVDLLLRKSASTKDTESSLNILCHAVGRVAEAQQPAVATSVASCLSKGDDHPEERVVALLNLYNATRVPAAQHTVLLSAAEFSRRNPSVCQLLGGAVKGKVDTWVREWNLSEGQTRELILALASVMKACGDRVSAKEYLKLMNTALASVKAGDTAALAALKPMAVIALQDFVKTPSSLFQCDLLELPAVAQLSSDKQHAGLLALVTKMLAGDFSGAKALVNPELVSAAGCSVEDVLAKARMVALLAHGVRVRAEHGELALDQLAATLEVTREQVEPWIVKAIGAKLLEGKIDQVRGVLSVARATPPSFESAQWTELSQRLASLKTHLKAATQQLANVKPPQAMAGRASAAAVAHVRAQ